MNNRTSISIAACCAELSWAATARSGAPAGAQRLGLAVAAGSAGRRAPGGSSSRRRCCSPALLAARSGHCPLARRDATGRWGGGAGVEGAAGAESRECRGRRPRPGPTTGDRTCHMTSRTVQSPEEKGIKSSRAAPPSNHTNRRFYFPRLGLRQDRNSAMRMACRRYECSSWRVVYCAYSTARTGTVVLHVFLVMAGINTAKQSLYLPTSILKRLCLKETKF